MTRTIARRARKAHDCADCRREIEPGEIYLRHVATPDDPDLGNEGWWHIIECADCATRYGRTQLLEERAAS